MLLHCLWIKVTQHPYFLKDFHNFSPDHFSNNFQTTTLFQLIWLIQHFLRICCNLALIHTTSLAYSNFACHYSLQEHTSNTDDSFFIIPSLNIRTELSHFDSKCLVIYFVWYITAYLLIFSHVFFISEIQESYYFLSPSSS